MALRYDAIIVGGRLRRGRYVFSIPILLRIYFKFKHDRKLLTQLCHCTKGEPTDVISHGAGAL